MAKIAKHIIFTGRVQGVGFRFTTHRIAMRYDLTGFVKNLPDGSVEMVAQGTESEISASLADIQEMFAGYLVNTKVTDTPLNTTYNKFIIAF